jgi:predicted tellurium resistance membrane protein TerC
VRPEGEGAGDVVKHGASLWEAIWIIIVADVTMSLDNVLAIAAAAHGEMMLVALGIAMSLPIVIWGAGLLARLMNRWQWIVWLGGGLLGFVAGEMALDDPVIRGWLGGATQILRYSVPAAAAALVTGVGWWLGRTPHAPVPEDV